MLPARHDDDDDDDSIQEQTFRRPFSLGISERERFAGFLPFLVLLGNMVRAE